MNVLERLGQALEEKRAQIAHQLFEKCVLDLLSEVWPGLTPIPGGTDMGRDGDAPDPQGGPPIRLLVTLAQDNKGVRANVRRGLKQLKTKQLRVKRAVVACAVDINGTQEQSLRDLCKDEYGVRLEIVYRRGWLVSRLRRDPLWAKALLDVEVGPAALVESPIELAEDPLGDLPLVGREMDLKWLRSHIPASDEGDAPSVSAVRDLVVTGVPGAGKTRLAAELAAQLRPERTYRGGGWFLERHRAQQQQLHEDLRGHEPQVVIVDDAHDRADELLELRQYRAQEQLRFSILALTWPDRVDDVAAVLMTSQEHHRELGLLERPQITQLLASMSITGHALVGEILAQAEGRPAWAIRLASLALRVRIGATATDRGALHRLLSGEELALTVEGYLKQTGQVDAAVDVLAAVAVVDGVSLPVEPDLGPDDDDVERLCRFLDDHRREVTALLGRAERSGLLDITTRYDGSVGGFIATRKVRPRPLADALVARWFFASTPRASFRLLLSAWPDRRLAVTLTTVRLATSGTPAARGPAERLVSEIMDGQLPAYQRLEVLREYALVDDAAARFAVGRAMALRDVVDVVDVPARSAVIDVLSAGLQRWLLPEAITALLELASDNPDDDGAQLHTPTGVLVRVAGRYLPDHGTTTKPRFAVLDAVTSWLRSEAAQQSGARQTVAIRVAAAMAVPQTRGAWMIHSATDQMWIVDGVELPEHLQRIAEQLWPLVVALLDDVADDATLPAFDLARSWVRASHSSAPAAATAAELAPQIIEALRGRAARAPGLAMRFNELAARSNLSALPVDPDLALLAGPIDYRADFQLAEQQHRALLAERVVQWLSAEPRPGPVELLDRVVFLHDQQHLARPRGGINRISMLLRALGDQADQPSDLASQLVRRHRELCVDAGELLHRALAEQPSESGEWLDQALGDPVCRRHVVRVALEPDLDAAITARVLGVLRDDDADAVSDVLIRRDRDHRPDATVHALLTHPVAAIRSTTAVGMSLPGADPVHGPSVPPEWRDEWRAALPDARHDRLRGAFDWLDQVLEQLVDADPELAAAWFDARLDEELTEGYAQVIPCDVRSRLLPRLPRAQRGWLLGRHSQTGHRFSLLQDLVGIDVEWVGQLLNEQLIDTEEALGTLQDVKVPSRFLDEGDDLDSGEGDEQSESFFEQMAVLLVRHGVAPATVSSTAEAGSWVGDRSAWMDAKVRWFTELAARDDPALASVGAAGVSLFEERRRQELDKEHKERVFGR